MSPAIRIEPDELRDAARTLREAGDAVGSVATGVRGGMPEMPGDLVGRVESTLGRVTADLTEQRGYLAGEARSLERHAFLAERADLPFEIAAMLADLFGFGEPPMLRERYTPPPPPAPPKPEREGGGGVLGLLHNTLDVAGFVPGLGAVPDVINAGIYGLEGDGENAAWSLGAAVPIAGDAAKGGKMIKKGIDEVAEHGDEAADAVRVTRVEKAESPVWAEARPYHGPTRTNGLNGKKREYYEWDHTHGDIEVYNSRGQHLGTKDPVTGELVKPPVPGRKIDL